MNNNFNSERYIRNTIISEVGEKGQLKLHNSKILVAGAGGLGSTVIPNLAAVGIGNIGIIDSDVIELSNLNRQYIHRPLDLGKSKVESAKNWVKNFNPEIKVKTYQIRLDKINYQDIIAEYDIVIDCFDSFKSKFLLNKICIENNKILIHGGVMEFYGQATVIIPSKTVCLNCLFPDNENAPVTKGVISPSVSVISSIQTMEAVKVILGIGDLLLNKLLTFNGLKQEYRKISLNRNPKCPVCH